MFNFIFLTVVLRHAGVCVRGAVLLYRISDLYRAVRTVPSPSSWPTRAGAWDNAKKIVEHLN